jgi:hypothetical protein
LAGLLVAATPVALACSSAAAASSGAPADVRVIGAVSGLRTKVLHVRRCNDDVCRRVRVRRTDARALKLYRALLPKGIAPAPQPRVGVWLTEVSVPYYGNPLWTDQHWIEGAVQLRVKFGRQLGWYPIYYPVTSTFWFEAGRYVGLPKAHADAFSSATPGGWTLAARSQSSGRETIRLGWTRNTRLRMSKASQALAESDSRGPFFVLNPAFQGPDIERVRYVVAPPSTPFGRAPAYRPGSTPELGYAQIQLTANTDGEYTDLPDIFPRRRTLADLIPLRQRLPATYRFNAIDLNSESQKVGTGGYRRSG